jgi:hypothetical protein
VDFAHKFMDDTLFQFDEQEQQKLEKDLGLKKLASIARMEKFWNELKAKGMFKDYNSYQEYCDKSKSSTL